MSSSPRGGNVARLPNRDSALKALYDDVSAKHMFPFWATSTDVEHDEVKQLLATPKAVPFVWRCAEDIEPILDRAVDLIRMDDLERRSLILVNPGLAPRRATVSTMYTAYRLNDANEIMPPHRHSPSAIRFGLKGKGNFTGVDGEDIVFGPGDMVLTPNDTWHNHGTVGNEQALNLSVLDLPLVETLNAITSSTITRKRRTASSFLKTADASFYAGLFAADLRVWRVASEVCRQKNTRRWPVVSDVCLSLGDDTRIARPQPGP